MKQVVKIILFMMCLTATTASARVNPAPYMAVSSVLDHVVFDKSVIGVAKIKNWNTGGEVAIGVDVNDLWGLELGYFHSIKSSEETRLSATTSQQFLGIATDVAGVLNDANDLYRISFITSALRLGVNGNYMLCDNYNVSLTGTLGISWENSRLKVALSSNGLVLLNDQVVTTLAAKSRAIFNAGIGAKWQFRPDSGLRFMAFWQNRSSMPKLSSLDVSGLNNRTFQATLKNSARFSLTLYSYL